MLSSHSPTLADRPTLKGGLTSKGLTNTIVSGSNIFSSHIAEPALRENTESATLPNVFNQYPRISAGQTNICEELGYRCRTKHNCSTANFARAGGGHQIHPSFGDVNTASNQSSTDATFHPGFPGHDNNSATNPSCTMCH